jgi:hypothetical protein
LMVMRKFSHSLMETEPQPIIHSSSNDVNTWVPSNLPMSVGTHTQEMAYNTISLNHLNLSLAFNFGSWIMVVFCIILKNVNTVMMVYEYVCLKCFSWH